MARRFNLITALVLCLIADAVLLAAWIYDNRDRFTNQMQSPHSFGLAAGLTLVTILAITWSVFLFRRRASAAANMESKFRSLLDATPDPIVIMNGDGIIRLVNARAEQLFQEARANLIGNSINTILVQSDRGLDLENSLADFRNSDPGSNPPESDLYARRKDGSRVPVDISFSPLETKEGTLTISILRDITDRKRAEHLRNTRHAVRRLLAESGSCGEAVPCCLEVVCKALHQTQAVFWAVNPQEPALLRFGTAWNGLDLEAGTGLPAAARTTTYSDGRGLPGLVWSSGKPAWKAELTGQADHLFDAAAREGAPEAFAFPVLSDAEFLGVVECFGRAPLPCDEGLAETLISIGSQLGRFLKHKQTEEAVRLSEARKAAILESALDAIITVDPDGRILEFNPAAEKLFDYPRATVIGERMAELIVPDVSRAAYGEGMSACGAGEGSSVGKRIELSLRRADGSLVPVELVVSRIRVEGPPLFTCYIRDLTERLQAEEALRRTEEQFQQAQKMEAIGRLAGGVAHDFNNLLTVINGYAQSLLGKLPPDSPHRPGVELINKAGNRAAGLTRQLLAFSRRQVLEPKVFCLNSVVAETSKMLQRMIGEDIALEVLPAANLNRIKADQSRIEQVLMNLAVNARDAMPTGGKLILETRNIVLDEADTRSRPEVVPGSYVLLAVTDNGVGMDEATQARIFEPFFTTKEVGKGTGLGLATVYGIIRQSGGHIAVYSEPNRGTTFKIYLPATEALGSPPAPCIRPVAQPSRKGTVLLVEDEDMVRALSTQVLQEQGYTVLQARHGKEALELSQKELEAVQLTVTDVVMPEMDGRDLAQRLLSRKPDMKVLYVSGYTEKAIVRNGLLEPDTIFLEKPFSPEGLVRKVHEMMSA
jgi:PAS domain S-box-containing protein